MKKNNYKGRCERRKLSKCEDVCRLFSTIQSVYADVLEYLVCNPQIIWLKQKKLP